MALDQPLVDIPHQVQIRLTITPLNEIPGAVEAVELPFVLAFPAPFALDEASTHDTLAVSLHYPRPEPVSCRIVEVAGESSLRVEVLGDPP